MTRKPTGTKHLPLTILPFLVVLCRAVSDARAYGERTEQGALSKSRGRVNGCGVGFVFPPSPRRRAVQALQSLRATKYLVQ